jgi:putative peptidoglycan lipid II flippase
VAALGLGNKIVTLASGLVAAAIVTVILPYFSSLMARNRLLDARKELSFFLLAATVATIPVALLIFEAANPLVRLMFKGGAFDDDAVELVAKVMSYGIIQLPFFTVNLLILKFAIASRHAGRVMVASLLGLGVNIMLNFVLMTKSGVAGIALATTLATATSTGFMLLLFHRLGHISWIDLIMIALSWMLYTTLVICLQYQSYPGVIVSLLALIVLMYGQWNILVRWRAAA